MTKLTKIYLGAAIIVLVAGFGVWVVLADESAKAPPVVSISDATADARAGKPGPGRESDTRKPAAIKPPAAPPSPPHKSIAPPNNPVKNPPASAPTPPVTPPKEASRKPVPPAAPPVPPASPQSRPATPVTPSEPSRPAPAAPKRREPLRRLGESRFNHGAPVTALAYTPDGQFIVSGSSGSLKLWNAVTGELVRPFEKDSENIGGRIALSPDGERMASSTSSGIGIWSVGDGSLAKVIKPHKRGTGAIVFAADGEHIVTGSGGDRTCELWLVRISSGEVVHRFEEQRGWTIRALALSSDGKKLYSGSDDVVAVWDMSSRSLLHSWSFITDPNHAPQLSGMALSPDGLSLSTWHDKPIPSEPAGTYGNTVTWDAASGRKLRVFSIFGPIAYSADGKRLLSCAYGTMQSAQLVVFDASSGSRLHELELKGSGANVGAVAMSPDGTRAAGGCRNGAIVVWNLNDHSVISPKSSREGVPVVTGSTSVAAFLPDGKHAILGNVRRGLQASTGDLLMLWSIEDGAAVRTLAPEATAKANMKSFSLSPDGRMAAISVGFREGFQVLNIEGAAAARTIGSDSPFQPMTPQSLDVHAWRPDSSVIASGGEDFIHLWNPATGELLGTIEDEQSARTTRLVWLPDGKRLISTSEDNTNICLWDTESKTLLSKLVEGTNAVYGLTLSADGRMAASYDPQGKNILIFDPENPASRRLLTLPSGAFKNIAFIAGGRLAASDAKSGVVWLISPASEEVLDVLDGHERPVAAMAVSPDGSRLLTCGSDGRVLLWDVSR